MQFDDVAKNVENTIKNDIQGMHAIINIVVRYLINIGKSGQRILSQLVILHYHY